MFHINKQVTGEDSVRALLSERAYVADLRDKGLALEIGNIVVDAPQIIERDFQCDTSRCVRLTKKGKRKGSCCTDLEVNLTPNEERNLRRLAKRRLALRRTGGGKRAQETERDEKDGGAPDEAAVRLIARRLADSDSWLEKNYRGEPCLAHAKDGLCVLGYVSRDGRLMCALNAMAEAIGEPASKWKLMTCFTFPLHYVEYEDGKYLLTIICKENHENMDADKYLGKLRCLREPPAGAPRAYESLKEEIELLLGRLFYARLRKAIEERSKGRNHRLRGLRG